MPEITVPVYVMRPEDARYLKGGVVEMAHLPPNPSRRSDEETARRVVAREARRRSYPSTVGEITP